MGYYDEWESVNNIHAIKGRYSSDRMQVDADESAIYTLRITELNGQKAFIFQEPPGGMDRCGGREDVW